MQVRTKSSLEHQFRGIQRIEWQVRGTGSGYGGQRATVSYLLLAYMRGAVESQLQNLVYKA